MNQSETLGFTMLSVGNCRIIGVIYLFKKINRSSCNSPKINNVLISIESVVKATL